MTVHIKKFFTLALTLLTLAACAPEQKEPRQMLEEALQKTEAYESYNLSGSMKTKFTMAGEEYEMDMTMEGVFFTSPMKARMEVTVQNTDGGEPTTSSMYLEEADGVYTMYVYSGTAGYWYGEEVSGEDAKSLMMDRSDTVKLFMDNSIQISNIAHEEINGQVSDTVEVLADPAIFSQIGADVAMGDVLTPEDFSNMGDLSYDVTITEEGISKLYMNLSGNFIALGEAMLNNPEATEEMKQMAEFYKSSEVITEFAFSNINAAEDFTIPEEAKQ